MRSINCATNICKVLDLSPVFSGYLQVCYRVAGKAGVRVGEVIEDLVEDVVGGRFAVLGLAL